MAVLICIHVLFAYLLSHFFHLCLPDCQWFDVMIHLIPLNYDNQLKLLHLLTCAYYAIHLAISHP